MPIFFVLSGYLISYPFFRQKKTGSTSWYVKNYARRRIGKILPPYYLSIILFTTWYLMAFSDTHYLAVAGLWASGLANFIQPALPFNASYWSLIVEAHFYILLPILFWLYRGAGLRTTCLNIFLWPFWWSRWPPRQWSWPNPVDYDRLIFLLVRFPSQLDFFGWGILFSGLYASLSATRQNFQALGLLGYAGVLLLLISLGLLAHWTTVYNVNAQPQRWSVEASHFLTGLSAFLMLFSFLTRPALVHAFFPMLRCVSSASSATNGFSSINRWLITFAISPVVPPDQPPIMLLEPFCRWRSRLAFRSWSIGFFPCLC